MIDVTPEWKRLHQDLELAKNYYSPYALLIGRTFRNPFMDEMLPSLVFIRLMSFLDDSFDEYIDHHSLLWPPKVKHDLNGRIEVLRVSKGLANAPALHVLRGRRNQVAHEAKSQSVTFSELDSAFLEVEHALLQLALITGTPKYVYFGERSAMAETADKKWERDFTFGLKRNDKRVLEWSWKEKMNPIGQ